MIAQIIKDLNMEALIVVLTIVLHKKLCRLMEHVKNVHKVSSQICPKLIVRIVSSLTYQHHINHLIINLLFSRIMYHVMKDSTKM